MNEYHKIQTIFKRDPKTKYKTLLIGEYSLLEFNYLKNNIWVFTEKIDGTNIRVKWENQELSFEGKTDKAQIPVFLFDRLNEIFSIELMKEVFPEGDVCLYGEGYGAKIQGGGGNYIPDGVDFILFDIKVAHWWLKRSDILIIAKQLNINAVPLIAEGTLNDLVTLVKGSFYSAIGPKPHLAEGIVARPKIELKDRAGRRIITKLKYKDFER